MTHHNGVLPTSNGIAQPAVIVHDVLPETYTQTDAAKPVLRSQANEYAELKRLVKQQGLLDKQPGYHLRRFLCNLLLLTVSVVGLFTIDNLWLQIGNAVFLAFTFGQFGFSGHDAGHRQVGGTIKQNNLINLLIWNLFLGASASWWIDKHNEHHGNPNVIDMDPDIDFPIVAFTEEQALSKTGPARLAIKYQAFLLPLLLTFVPYNMRVQSVLKIVRGQARHPLVEGLLMLAHWVLYVGALFYCLPFWQALTFILVHQALVGLYLGSVFAANHKGMPVLEKDTELSFLRLQVLTSRNVRSHPLTDWLYGGLNFQIEHHLFPGMPQKNLRAAQRIVKQFCAQRDIPYYETGFLQALKEVLVYLHQVSAPLRSGRA